MRNHLEAYWGIYLMLALVGALLAVIIRADVRDQERTDACFDRGMIVVRTDAGYRCAPVYSLEKIR